MKTNWKLLADAESILSIVDKLISTILSDVSNWTSIIAIHWKETLNQIVFLLRNEKRQRTRWWHHITLFDTVMSSASGVMFLKNSEPLQPSKEKTCSRARGLGPAESCELIPQTYFALSVRAPIHTNNTFSLNLRF